MRMFLYYAWHTLINQIRKLLKTWVLIFILICAVMGGVLGFGAAKLGDMAEETEPAQEELAEPEDGEPLFEAEFEPPLEKLELLELIAGLVVLAVLVIEVLGADKNGARIFLPADVSLLFSAPLRPQSVLMFRLGTQMGVALFASLYLVFQLPALIGNMGLSAWAAVAVIGSWCLTVMLGKLLQVLCYLAGSAHPGFKRSLRYGVYAVLALIAGGFALFYRRAGLELFEAVGAYFNAPVTRFIPIWGWLKGLCVFAARGSTGGALACLAGLLAAVGLLWWCTGRMKADFYEDAMQRSEELAEALERAQRDGAAVVKRKKDRSERLRRDGFTRGFGANVYFHKALYNRARFAWLGYFTKTCVTYLVVGAGVSAFLRYALETDLLAVPALAMGGFAFFRSLGDPMHKDTAMPWFVLIPEPMYPKLLWSLLGGTAVCLLDVLPGMLAAVVILGASPLAGLAWMLVIATVQMYSTAVGSFIGVSVPVNAGKTLKQLVQVLFVYFGLVPDIAILAIGIVMGRLVPAAAIAAAFNTGAALLFLLFSSLVLEP